MEKMVEKLPVCKNFVLINKIIDHIFQESANSFVGIVHKNNWKVYHDAMTLFVAADSYEYM